MSRARFRTIQEARADHNYKADRIRPEEVHKADLVCLPCGHVWNGNVEDGVPEGCIRPDCGAPSDQVARA